jgi:release factor glutamine methyltransferase
VTAGDTAAISIGAARRDLARRFAKAGLESPELDARVLAGHALGLDHARLIADAGRELGSSEVQRLDELAARRLGGEPVARIVGIKEFWGLPFRLNPATLVPRPDTETVVEAALASLDRDGGRKRDLLIADLGTGSGAILLALLSELPQAFGVGTDVSRQALTMARDNALRLGPSRRAAFIACDFGAALAGGFDLVVSNPPYIPSAELAGLPAEVRHDPLVALDGGADGCAAYRAIAADARRLLRPGGHMVVELGLGAGAAVSLILGAAGFSVVGPPRRDLSGQERALHVRRN